MKLASIGLFISIVASGIPLFETLIFQQGCFNKENKAFCCQRVFSIHEVCVVIEVDEDNAMAYRSLLVDGEEYNKTEIQVARARRDLEFCIQIPGVSLFHVCVKFYDIDISITGFKLQICAKLSSKFLVATTALDFGCIKFQNGIFDLRSQPRNLLLDLSSETA